MSLDLVNHRLAVERVAVENAAETVVEGTIALSGGAPEIGRALKVDAAPHLVEVEVKEGKVVFEGSLDLTLLYAHFEERVRRRDTRPGDEDESFADEDGWEADEQEDEIIIEERLETYSWEKELPFAFLLELPGVVEGQPVMTHVETGECTFEVRSDQASVDVDVVVRFEAKVVEIDHAIVATGVVGGEGIDVETRSVRVRNLLGQGEARVEAADQLSLQGLIAPERFLEVEAEVDVTETQVDENIVKVRGNVSYTALYEGSDGAGPQFAHWVRGASFEVETPVEGARRGAKAEVDVTALNTEYRLVQTAEDGSALSVKTPLNLQIRAVEVGERRLVTGLMSEANDIASRSTTLRIVESVGEGESTAEVEESLDLPKGMPGIERVLFGGATPTVDDVHVLGDKVAVELHVDVDLAYVARSAQEGGVHMAEWPQAFRLDVEIPLDGAEPGLDRRVSVDVDSVQFDLTNRETVDVHVTLTATAAVSKEVEVDVITDAVEVPPADPNPPTYTFVVIEEGDTVWKLAARYRSHADAIVEANQWLESEDDILPLGKKVCVPRKVPEPAA